MLVIIRPSPVWWALIGLVVALILALELLNSALESFVDLIHPEIHPEIKAVKDMAAGAVLVLSTAAVGVGAAMIINEAPRLVAEIDRFGQRQ